MGLVDFSEYDPTNLGAGDGCTTPGKVVLLITSAEEKEGDYGSYYAVTFDIKAHEIKGQIDKELYQSISLSGKGSKRVMKLAKAAGILTDEDIAAAILTGTKSLDLKLEETYGQLVCGEIKLSRDKKPVIWDFWAINDPAVSDWPKVGAGEVQRSGDQQTVAPAQVQPTTAKLPQAAQPRIDPLSTPAATDDDIPF